MAADETQTAYAKSVFSDPQILLYVVNIALASLALPEVRAIIPDSGLRYVLALSGVLGVVGMAVRTWIATHPVAFIAPGQVKPVEVKKLEATKQGTEDAEKLPTQLPNGDVPK